MFKNTKAFSSFSVNDRQVAKKFYGETLGLDVTEIPEGLMAHTAGGGEIFIYQKKADHVPATFTVLNFSVPNIEEAMNNLKAVGVTFEHYDVPGTNADEKGITHNSGPRMIAWFKDPAGNVLSVIQEK